MIPVLDIEPLQPPVLGALHDGLWTVLCNLTDRHEADWTVIGRADGRAPRLASEPLTWARQPRSRFW